MAQKLGCSKVEGDLIAKALYEQGLTKLRNCEYEQAEMIFRAAAEEIHTGVRWPWIGVIQALACQRKTNQAMEESLNAALSLREAGSKPPVPLPWWLFQGEGVTRDIINSLGQVAQKYPEDEEVLISLSLAENKLSDYRQAEIAMEKAGLLRWSSGQHINKQDGDIFYRKMPSFLIIGQAKAGTTSLYELLCKHEEIDPPLLKEPSYWSLYFEAGRYWYKQIFPPIGHRTNAITFEASTSYYHHPLAPLRIKTHLPSIRLILLLRDPADRAYSEYNQYVRLGMERRSWQDVIEDEITSIEQCPLSPGSITEDAANTSFLVRAASLAHLKRYLAHFSPQQILILDYQRLISRPETEMKRVYEFIGISNMTNVNLARVNEGHYDPMSEQTRGRLRSWFHEHNLELQEVLRSLSTNL